MWADPQHGRLFSDNDVRELLERVTDRVGSIVAGPTLDAVIRETRQEVEALDARPLEPAVLIPAGHEAGPGMMDLWARVQNVVGEKDAGDRTLDHVDRAVDWQARRLAA